MQRPAFGAGDCAASALRALPLWGRPGRGRFARWVLALSGKQEQAEGGGMAGLLPAFFTLHLGNDVHPGLFPAREGSRESAEDAKSGRSAAKKWICWI
ncbi:hypothetical protein D7X33_09670 [Butyricicoccus sp. 1XD8-22]|nr:hypothetical protein D7X33_09670 [Butyricicoccus sp. 1XD8-22]